MLKSAGILFLCGVKKKKSRVVKEIEKMHEYKMSHSYVFQMNCPLCTLIIAMKAYRGIVSKILQVSRTTGLPVYFIMHCLMPF